MTARFPADKLDAQLDAVPGEVGFVCRGPGGRFDYRHLPDRIFPCASVIKLPVMVELFRQVAAGERALADRVRVPKTVCSFGTGVLGLMHDQPELTLADLCRLMIGVSDDPAADTLVGVLGLERINDTLATLGLHRTRMAMTMGRWHYRMAGLDDATIHRANDAVVQARLSGGAIDPAALSFAPTLDNNVTTAADMAALLERILRGDLFSKPACDAMLDMLHLCNHRGMIPRDLPPGVPVAHKVGQSHGLRADVGIVFLDTGPLIIAALSHCREEAAARPGRDTIAQASGTCARWACAPTTPPP